MFPSEDGITHINVYSKAETELGRFLSNFSHTPIRLSDGKFESLEGYWYWLKTQDDKLRSMIGYEAKQYGRTLPIVHSGIDKSRFKKALKVKINNNREWLANNTLWNDLSLPLTHYYVYDDRVVDAGSEWMLDILEQLRFDTAQ